ncbi:MAG: YceD family protein [Bacteroidota bacterium]
MMSLKEFEVDIVQPPDKITYELGADFFALFEHSLLEKGRVTATISISSQRSELRFLFSITGTIELLCDRSLEQFAYPVAIEEEVIFIYGHEDKALSAALYMLKPKTTMINIAQHIYDFVSLAIPMKKLHPRFAEIDLSEQV